MSTGRSPSIFSILRGNAHIDQGCSCTLESSLSPWSENQVMQETCRFLRRRLLKMFSAERKRGASWVATCTSAFWLWYSQTRWQYPCNSMNPLSHIFLLGIRGPTDTRLVHCGGTLQRCICGCTRARSSLLLPRSSVLPLSPRIVFDSRDT